MINLKFTRTALIVTFMMCPCLKSWAAELQSTLRLQGETLNFEIIGQKNWDYDVKRVKENNQTKVQLQVKGVSEQSLKDLKNVENPFVKSVKVLPRTLDGLSTIEFVLKADDVEAFDYLTDQPSKLIVDFYHSEEPVAFTRKSDAKKTIKKNDASAAVSKKTTARKPAAVDFLRVNDQDGIETFVDPVDLKSGLFDGSDDRFSRFKMGDFEISPAAILKGLTNYYLNFPMLNQEYGFWKKMKENPPDYEITPSATEENKQARLLQTLFKKNRPLVLQKTTDWFEQKYPESKHLESALFMLGDSQIDLWRTENKTENFEQGIRAYTKAIEKFPKSSLAERTSLSLGFLYLDKKDYLSAVRRLNTHIENPNYKGRISQQYAKLGLAYSIAKLKKINDAVQNIEDVEKNSQDPLVKAEAAFRKGDFYMGDGQYAKAIKTYEDALKAHDKFAPLFPNAYFNRMEALFRTKLPEQAHQVALEFVQKFPSHSYAPYGLTRVGELLEIIGADQTKSVGAYLETHFRYGDSPKTIVARLHLLSTRMKSMKQQELDQTIQKMDELSKGSELENINQFKTTMIADGYGRRHEYEKAIDILSHFYQESPGAEDSFQVTNRIVKSVNEQIKYLSDKKDYRNVLKVYKKYSDSWIKNQDRIDTDYFVARAYTAAGAYSYAAQKLATVKANLAKVGQDTRSLFIKANQVLPLMDEVSLAQAQCAYNEDKFQDSYQFLQSISKPEALSDSEQIERVHLASQLYEKRGDVDSAIRYLSEIVRVWKDKPQNVAQSAIRLAELEAKKENYTKSVDILKGIVDEKIGAAEQIKAYKLMSDVGLKAKNQNVAIQALSDLLEKFEKNTPLAEERYKLGEIYYNKGELKKAENIWSDFKGTESDFWKKVADEKIKSAQWKDDYNKYLKRIPATSGEF